MQLTRFCLALITLSGLAPIVHAQDWGRFRGPNGSGNSAATHLPAELGAPENKRWRAELPKGQSSPVVGKDAVFVTGADEGALIVVSVDRKTGARRWERRVERTQPAEGLFPANDLASPSPVTDGENVYAFFHELGLI
jgi:hypothetical protein